jgi:hypothetical protein
MRQALITFVHPKVLRAAVVIALGTIVCAGLSACATDNQAASGAASGGAASAWVQTPNQPNYSDLTYHGRP